MSSYPDIISRQEFARLRLASGTADEEHKQLAKTLGWAIIYSRLLKFFSRNNTLSGTKRVKRRNVLAE